MPSCTEPLQTGLIILGESRSQKLDQLARQLATKAAMLFATDVLAAGEASLKQPSEHVPSLETVTAGGRELTPSRVYRPMNAAPGARPARC